MIVQCTQCQTIYPGHETTDDRIVPKGVTACYDCDSETFKQVTLADFGLE